MAGHDLWAALYPKVGEVFRLMMTGATVEVMHPRYAGTIGTVEALIIRPGKDNVYEITVAAEVQEAGRNSVQVTLPEYIRKVERNGREEGCGAHALAGVQGSRAAGEDHSGYLQDPDPRRAGDPEGGGEDPAASDGAELQETAS